MVTSVEEIKGKGGKEGENPLSTRRGTGGRK